MTRKMTSASAIVLVVCLLVVANSKPNFSGAWVMDRDRSFGQPANMQQTMTVSQTEDQITVETKLILPEYRTYVKADKKLRADDRRIRLRSADEFEKLVEAANTTQ